MIISLLKLAMMGICIDRLNQPDTLYLEKGANLMLRSSGEYFTIVLALWVHIHTGGSIIGGEHINGECVNNLLLNHKINLGHIVAVIL